MLVLVGSNLAETMPPAARHLDALRARGGQVVVIDPRRTPTADRADVFVQPVPGSDLALALGVLHLLVAGGTVDEDVRRRPHHRLGRRARVGGRLVAGAGRAGHRRARRRGAGAGGAAGRQRPKVVVLTARGAEQHSTGSDTVLAWINVALALGMPGTPGAGYGCLTGQGNGQGGREHGQKADQLPGYRMIDDPAARAHVAGVWGVRPDSLPGKGRSAYELLDALGQPGGPSALLVFGSNIVVSAPRATHVTQRLESLDLLVVADMVLSETAALADVVLPVTQWAEETGTMTNLEGRVILRQRAITPPAGRPLGPGRDRGTGRRGSARRWSSPPTPRRSSRSSAGRRRAGRPTTPASPTTGSATSTASSGRARSRATRARRGCSSTPSPTPTAGPASSPSTTAGRPRSPSADYPVHLTTGRVLAQYQSGAQTRRVRDLPDTGPFVELHPMLAGRIGAVDGEPVTVATRRGTMTAPARVVATIRPDTVFVPFHWVGANRLTNDALDPASRMPEFKVCAAAVST